VHRLLHPRTVAVAGATDRAGSPAGQTLLNLRALFVYERGAVAVDALAR
jgi:acyl-CoA synthetase (NDP forming)